MGLAPKVVDTIFELLATLAATGTALLLVEQFVTRALALCVTTSISCRKGAWRSPASRPRSTPTPSSPATSGCPLPRR